MDFTFHGQLKPFQEEAIRKMAAKDFGILVSATGFGKTLKVLIYNSGNSYPDPEYPDPEYLVTLWPKR